jgi:uncharacterized protein YndB with AHSA1/START domain
MNESRFVYVIYIRTTAEKLWDALRKPEYTRQYWAEVTMESDWKQGSSWRMVAPNGKLCDSGKILEIEPNKKLVLSWQNDIIPELHAEGFSQATIELHPIGDTVMLTITHSIDHEKSKLIADFANGWPPLMCSLKSLLETGQPLAITTKWPEGM